MKTRYLLYPVLTGLFSALLMLVAIQASGTSLDWLQAHLFLPGQVLAAGLFSHATHNSTSPLYLFVEFTLNFLITWIGLLFMVFFLDRVVATLHELKKI
jgi:hypothetical protein